MININSSWLDQWNGCSTEQILEQANQSTEDSDILFDCFCTEITWHIPPRINMRREDFSRARFYQIIKSSHQLIQSFNIYKVWFVNRTLRHYWDSWYWAGWKWPSCTRHFPDFLEYRSPLFNCIEFLGSNWQVNDGSDNGWAPNRRWAKFWTNCDIVHWRIYASLSPGELISSYCLYAETGQ